MQYGLFSMPLHPPERTLTESYDLDIAQFVLADQLGYTEGWMGEHYTIPWENHPAVDLFIASLIPQTEQIRLGTGVILLPMHDPRHVALRIAYLDNLAKGRLNFGIGSGGAVTDFALFGIDHESGEHRERTKESIEVIQRMWTESGPFEHHGKYWDFTMPADMPEVPLGHFIRPYQDPHPPIAVAGLHERSETLSMAGANGWIPMSINYLPTRNLKLHWDTVSEAALKAGRTPDRRKWRIAREIYVAETDEIARNEVLNGPMRRAFEQYMRRVLASFASLGLYKVDPDMPDEGITAEYLAEDIWIVGSPDTVTEKLRNLYDGVGGFGSVLQIAYDWEPEQGRFDNCMRLLANEVMPNLADLVPEPEAVAAAGD
jgi:alkanesulfonate monooxygenase SsuD/methylene tetrahydromethanopterin reductase-like flavin-dependent oxidoreductase (luciferase family)